VDAIVRGNIRGENPDANALLRAHDFVVISGLPEDVARAEKHFQTGKH
jgi:CPA2 family monovalent cation:H+ antiporter-2